MPSHRWPDRERLLVELDALLPEVEKPTRYIGGEWNSVVPDLDRTEVSVALAFPDLYEIGMSHLGFRILYALLNRQPGLVAERVFMPWVDMLRLLRERDLPLVTLETRRPLAELDLVGFSMQSELTATNVLAMLERGGIPLTAAERGEADPFVLMGGPVVFNPEPYADFVDLVLVGDAEEALPEMLDRFRALRREGASRREILRAIGQVEGWYAPALYEVEPEPHLGMLIPRPAAGEPVPERVRRRVVYDLEAHPFPAEVVVPHAEIVHDRVSWEIMRGCPVGCRFCQAGYVYRPTRERSPDAVAAGVRESLAATGYDEFSLTSLNTGEYGAIEPLLTGLMDEMEPRHVSVGLSSLHATTMTEALAAQVKRVRKTGFTMAPEAGTQRMRDVINKNLTEADVLRATGLAFAAGWSLIKLYFMIGLPAETMEDVDGIAALAGRIQQQGRESHGNAARVTLSASTFVPKPFTPFQWFGMDDEATYRAKQERIRRAVRRGVSFKHHDRSGSWLEGVLSRADRGAGRAILAAFRRGALLDGWSEHLDVGAWRAAFEACGIDADALATRALPLEAPLPWEVIDPLVRRSWLEREYHRALEAATVVPCGAETCTACAPFARECIKGVVQERRWTDFAAPAPVEPRPLARLPVAGEATAAADESASPAEPEPRPVYRYRASFRKEDRSRFLGHLDLVRALMQAFRRAGIRLVYSQGFKPKPKVSLSPALGLGIASREEYVDFETYDRLDREGFVHRVNPVLPHGLQFVALVPIEVGARALQDVISGARYRVRLPDDEVRDLGGAVRAFLARRSAEVLRVKKGRERRVDIRPYVDAMQLEPDGAVSFTLLMTAGGSARPSEVLGLLLGDDPPAGTRIERTALWAEAGGRWISPLVAGRWSPARTA
jgi:radical SAM family uncharacterized protein/radical SAM-linked protein